LNVRLRFISLLLLIFPACGRVGPPQPPFIRIPEAVQDLAVTQRGYDLVLTWTNPPRYVDGSAATNLSRVLIRTGNEPLAAVNVTAAGQAQAHEVPIVLPVRGGERTFTVVLETTQGKVSDVSNVASITPVEVPGRVTQLMAETDQRRIFLRWAGPRDHPEFADVYIVTRTDNAQTATVTDKSYEDFRYEPGKALTYHVTAARRVGGGLVPGVGPEPILATAVDKTPPMVPSGIEIRESDTGGFLTWEANGESDLAGYRVFRSDQVDGGFKPLSEAVIGRNSFFDPSYRAGLYYTVSAVDESRNESAMSAPLRGP